MPAPAQEDISEINELDRIWTKFYNMHLQTRLLTRNRTIVQMAIVESNQENKNHQMDTKGGLSGREW